jgi:hypothetical protein
MCSSKLDRKTLSNWVFEIPNQAFLFNGHFNGHITLKVDESVYFPLEKNIQDSVPYCVSTRVSRIQEAPVRAGFEPAVR